MNILIYLDNFDGNLPPPEITEPFIRWSGRQLISLALPSGLNVNMKNDILICTMTFGMDNDIFIYEMTF